MDDLRPYYEPLRTTLTRTVAIALVAAAVVAPRTGGLRSLPILILVFLWPALGGHVVELFFLNVLRPRLPSGRPVQAVARLAAWFVGGILLALGMRLTANALLGTIALPWLTWVVAGGAFIAIELVAHAGLHLRGRPSFYNGLA